MMFFTKDSLSYITSPADLDSHFYWFAADVGVTDSLGGAIANNEGVGTWADLSGNGYDVTQTTNGARPVYKATGGPGSKPCIQFDGSNDFLVSAAHWWGSDDLTVFVVMKFGNATRDASESMVSRWGQSTNARQFNTSSTGTSLSYGLIHAWGPNGIATGTDYSYGGAKSTAFRAVTWTSNSSNAGTTLHIDGSSVGLTDGLPSTTTTTMYDFSQQTMIGALDFASPTAFLQGSISEIIVYSRALTTAERIAIENYLNKKYDLY